MVNIDPDRFADSRKRHARSQCFASARAHLRPWRTIGSRVPWQFRALHRNPILPRAILPPAVFQRRARDIAASAATVHAHLPDAETPDAAMATADSIPARCPCHKGEEGSDDNRAW